jgi:hypothetical protein
MAAVGAACSPVMMDRFPDPHGESTANVLSLIARFTNLEIRGARRNRTLQFQRY